VDAAGVKIWVKVKPNARSSEIAGWESDAVHGRVLRVRLSAPPVDGKANDALRHYLAKALGVPKSRIALEKGTTSRFKLLEIPDNSPLPL
jgi:uncharacterized protein (TIGR00251 family)